VVPRRIEPIAKLGAHSRPAARASVSILGGKPAAGLVCCRACLFFRRFQAGESDAESLPLRWQLSATANLLSAQPLSAQPPAEIGGSPEVACQQN